MAEDKGGPGSRGGKIVSKKVTRGPRKGQTIMVYAKSGTEIKSGRGATKQRRAAARKAGVKDRQGRTAEDRGKLRRGRVRDIKRNPKSPAGKRAGKAIAAGETRFKKRKTTPGTRRTRRRRAGK